MWSSSVAAAAQDRVPPPSYLLHDGPGLLVRGRLRRLLELPRILLQARNLLPQVRHLWGVGWAGWWHCGVCVCGGGGGCKWAALPSAADGPAVTTGGREGCSTHLWPLSGLAWALPPAPHC